MTNENDQLEHVVVVNGTIKNPIDRNAFFMTFELIVSIVGILMNISIACVIVFDKHLRNKPRNIFLLGLVLSNLLASIRLCMEFSYFVSPNHELCQAYIATAGLPYVLFLTNMLLALFDRYAAIFHPLWHKEKVTVRLAVFSQLIASISISVIFKFAYIAQFIPLNCEMQLTQFKIVAVIFLILFLSCIVLQVVVYRRTRQIIANYGRSKRGRTARKEKRVSFNFLIVIFNLIAQQIIEQPIPANYVGESVFNSKLLDVHVSDSSINRLEIEATTTLIASVTSLSVVSGPIILFSFFIFICQLYIRNHVCNSISWLAPYFPAIISLHVVYHPIFYFFRSTELKSVAKKLFKNEN